MSRSHRPRRWAITLLVLASLLILGLLLAEADPRAVAQALARVSWGWLGLALVIKVAALTLHELRLWWLLRTSHPCPLPRVMGIGFLSGLINTVLPVRAGDLVAALLLRKEQGVPGPAVTSATPGSPVSRPQASAMWTAAAS